MSWRHVGPSGAPCRGAMSDHQVRHAVAMCAMSGAPCCGVRAALAKHQESALQASRPIILRGRSACVRPKQVRGAACDEARGRRDGARSCLGRKQALFPLMMIPRGGARRRLAIGGGAERPSGRGAVRRQGVAVSSPWWAAAVRCTHTHTHTHTHGGPCFGVGGCTVQAGIYLHSRPMVWPPVPSEGTEALP